MWYDEDLTGYDPGPFEVHPYDELTALWDAMRETAQAAVAPFLKVQSDLYKFMQVYARQIGKTQVRFEELGLLEAPKVQPAPRPSIDHECDMYFARRTQKRYPTSASAERSHRPAKLKRDAYKLAR